MYLDNSLTTEIGQVETIKDFISKYHPSMTVPGVVAAIESDKIDAIKPARDIFIVLTSKTKSYQPRAYKTKNR